MAREWRARADGSRLLAAADIADICGVAASAVSNWRARPNVRHPLPAPFYVIRGRPLWHTADIERWLSARLEHERANVARHERALSNAIEREDRAAVALAVLRGGRADG